jgi:SAM-dependent methyltransferase
MANLLSDIDIYMADIEREEKAERDAINEKINGGEIVALGDGEIDPHRKTPSMKFQEEIVKLRESLGYNVERSSGGSQVFTAGETICVIERREDGAQTHLRSAEGGWVVERSPTTLEPLCLLEKQVSGGYPPMSTVLNPDPKTSPTQTFLPALDYKQMNGLALEMDDDTFDCVLIKGTLDSFLTKGIAGRKDALLLLEQVYRVLKPTGKFICVSHGGEHPDLLNRLVLLKEDLGGFKWSVEARALPKPQQPGLFHQAYVCTPQPIQAGEIWDAEEAQASVVT